MQSDLNINNNSGFLQGCYFFDEISKNKLMVKRLTLVGFKDFMKMRLNQAFEDSFLFCLLNKTKRKHKIMYDVELYLLVF